MELTKKQQLQAAIASHLASSGSNNWNVIINQFKADMSEATIWRAIRAAKTADVPRPELITAKAKTYQKVKFATNDRDEEAKAIGATKIAKHIPAAPSPRTIAKSGEAGLANIDFAMEIRNLYSDALMLRSFSVSVDTEGVEKIKNPVMFEKQIGKRTQLIETTIKVLQELWDLRTMQNFYEIIIEEISAESPETAHRIMERLHELNSKHGLTMSMKV